MSRRADRLFRLIDELRGRRLAVTGAELATALEVSPRTIYRDIADLMASGVPIRGEAGVGYRLDESYALPPVMFTREEVLALLVGGRMVQAFTDPELANAARSAEVKIRAILDDGAKAAADAQPYRVPVLSSDEGLRATHGRLRRAIEARQIVRLDYRDEGGAATERDVWPLGIIGWTGRWTLLGWCLLRDDYRNFRLDRIAALQDTGETYPVRADRSIAHFVSLLDRDPPDGLQSRA
ncbi:helix-turn-helix transcriptional regulator [Oceanomicrobium pacificus]|uniref:WYL domain-containing protein n=1 Tax=Oceanomicrobium pacificus TaxID=2692916 RepID=A0A6B0U6D1_9RHOB|nr:YafY family protein [Oceanomicrobium pacificus]MXU66421.1 WYL domain-containing protein [Oceanomicrobium pacificus]